MATVRVSSSESMDDVIAVGIALKTAPAMLSLLREVERHLSTKFSSWRDLELLGKCRNVIARATAGLPKVEV